MNLKRNLRQKEDGKLPSFNESSLLAPSRNNFSNFFPFFRRVKIFFIVRKNLIFIEFSSFLFFMLDNFHSIFAENLADASHSFLLGTDEPLD